MDKFIDLVKEKYSEEDSLFIIKAYNFACKAHEKQRRDSGEPYIIHPIAVATILIDLGLDKQTIAAALLHDVVEDTPCSFKKIGEIFGLEVEKLVKAVSKINNLKYEDPKLKQMDNLKRLFIAMGKDVRVILIKLADRLHNIRTIDCLTIDRKIRICNETMNIFVPLAERLGLNNMKLEIEDKCFEILNPNEYKKLKDELDRKYVKTTERMKNIEANLVKALETLGLKGVVKSRLKHFYSLYRKIKSRGTAKIYDIIAFRILVDNQDDCYRVLGEIHKMYKPVFGRMKDYIAAPKPNGYKSLHTTLITKDGTPFEVQIRTYEMHEYNQYGIASHWRYKQGDKPSDIIDEKLNWIRSIIEDEKQIRDSENFIKALQMDFSTSEIWVFTPKLKPISLPEKATPIDMAYAVHTDLGNTCVGAKVNDKKVPLTYKLDTGDVVEIITSKQSKGPSREWLKIAVSTNARSHIRNFFKKSIKPENVRIGKQILEFKAEEQNVPIGSCLSNATLEQIKSKYLIYSLDDMFASIATGSLRAIDIINIARVKEKSSVKEKARAQSPVLIEGSEVEGVKFAHCCNPIPGDGIYAISSNSGITIHCEDCVNLKTVDKDRLLVAEWKAQDEHKLFDGSLRICGVDKVGVLNEVIGVLYTQGIIFTNISAKTVNEKKFEILVQIKVKDKKQLESLCSQIEKIECVEFVNRNNLN